MLVTGIMAGTAVLFSNATALQPMTAQVIDNNHAQAYFAKDMDVRVDTPSAVGLAVVVNGKVYSNKNGSFTMHVKKGTKAVYTYTSNVDGFHRFKIGSHEFETIGNWHE